MKKILIYLAILASSLVIVYGITQTNEKTIVTGYVLAFLAATIKIVALPRTEKV